MKRMAFAMLSLLAGLLLAVPVRGDGLADPKFGDTRFMAYQGEQRWPTAENAEAITAFSVPIYMGLPTRPYRVLGRIYDPRTSGIGVVGRAFAEGLFSEEDRQRDCANQAKYRGANAVVVTDDERILATLGLGPKEVEKSAPLLQHKDRVVLAIELQ